MVRPRLSLLAALICASALSFSTPALACKCMLPPVETARADASAVFEGRVVSIEPLPEASPATNGELRVTLRVVRTWKSLDRDERVVVFTNGSSAACGFSFAADTSYLVYARSSDDQRLHVSGCSRTRRLSEAAGDLAFLGAGSTPVSVEKARPASLDAGAPANVGGYDGGDGNLPPPTPATATPAVAHKKRGCSVAWCDTGAAELGWLALPVYALWRRRRAKQNASH